MEDHGSGARGGRSGDKERDADRQPPSDREYSWGGKPGEDFGPIDPIPPARPAPSGAPEPGLLAPRSLSDDTEVLRRPTPVEPNKTESFPRPAPDDAETRRRSAREPFSDETAILPRPPRDPFPDETTRTPISWPSVDPEPRRPVGAPPVTAAPIRSRRRLWRPILTMLAVLLVLGGLVGGVLFVLSRQAATSSEQSVVPSVPSPVAASPAASPAVVGTPVAGASPGAQGTAATSPGAVLGLGTIVPPTPAVSPTLGAPATRATPTTIAQTPTPRASTSPVIAPTPPGLFAPPGVRFPTSTPARIVATRTPPPVPTLRPVSPTTPLRVDKTQYKVGEEASVCAQATYGSSAQISVLLPDGTQRALGEFQPPADRVCQAVRLDNPGIYVITLTVKESNGRELERHATVVSAAR